MTKEGGENGAKHVSFKAGKRGDGVSNKRTQLQAKGFAGQV